MRRAFYLIGIFALCLVYGANAEDALLPEANLESVQETASSMIWPMLPGESVLDLARLFYPKNRVMQQQFVAKTLRLNLVTQSNLKATARFDAPTLLVIPTLKSLSKSAARVSKKSNKSSLKMSYGLQQASEQLPQKLIQQYEELVHKNAFLKEQLAKLSEKITLLQSKLDALKLILDKRLTLPKAGLPNGQQLVASPPLAKKVFKNLNQKSKPAEISLLDRLNMELNMDVVKLTLAIVALILFGAFVFIIILKKYRERMFDNPSVAAVKVPPTMTDSSGQFENKTIVKQQESPAVTQQVSAAKEVEAKLDTTLEEAKLLISVNRVTDAIAHLKATIAAQPKTSISHWLYLLDVLRKFNMKEDFEQYAERLHQTFNVMTPVWVEKSAEIYVPQSLEEFPHIMEQLYGVWPGELASVYLRSLITDNRGGDRTGFGKEVLDEILVLITLLDTQKE